VRYGYRANYQTPGYKVSKGRDGIKLLLQHGAMWKPDPSTFNDTRRILYRIEPDVTVELIGLLLKNSDGENGVRELLRVPRMRQHVASCERQLARSRWLRNLQLLAHLGQRDVRDSVSSSDPLGRLRPDLFVEAFAVVLCEHVGRCGRVVWFSERRRPSRVSPRVIGRRRMPAPSSEAPQAPALGGPAGVR
jgi:hypothetical protein